MKIKTIKMRMAIYIVFFTVITLLIVGSYVINLYSTQLITNLKEMTNLKLELVSGEIEDVITTKYQLFLKIQDNDELQEIMLKEVTSDYTDADRKLEVSNILREYAYSDINVISVFILDKNKEIQDPFYQIEPYSNIVSSYTPLQDYYLSGTSTLSPIGKFPLKLDTEIEGIKTLTYIEDLLSKEDFSSLGTVLISSKVDYLLFDFIEACRQNFDMVYIVNRENEMVYSSFADTKDNVEQQFFSSIMNQLEEKQSSLVDINKSTYYISKKNIDIYDDWTLIGVKEYTDLKANYTDITNLLFTFGLMSIPVLLLFSYLFARSLTNPIVKLSHAMKEFSDGEWPDVVTVETHDELEQLVTGFNEMVGNQFKLIEQIVHEQEISKQKEVETIKLQLELLQSQINPHFIHNTLNAISYLVKNNKNIEAEEMLKSFNVLLRSSMSHKEDTITLFDEIECIKSYVVIQKIRYDGIFEIVYKLDESLIHTMVPKLILQPLVENAIYHGIIPKDSQGVITISVYEDKKQRIVISVEDDGVGIDKDINEKDKLSFNGISFENINKRLALTYGNETRLIIDSIVGKGTKVFFRI